MFQDWKSKIKNNPQVAKHLLWDVNTSNLSDEDWYDMRKLVVQRVIEQGDENDFYAIFKLYGGPKGVREIIKQIPAVFSPRDEAFVRTVFNLKKEDFSQRTVVSLTEQ
jgi:hypothetical protein